jgi:hypothetical protein
MTEADRETLKLTSFCMALGALFGVLIGGWLAPPTPDEPWLKTYGTLVSAAFGLAGAAMGISYATRNLLRQMRVNLISREEDRIDKVLPGLRDAEYFVRDLLMDLALYGNDNAASVLHDRDISEIAQVRENLPKRLERCDPSTIQTIVGAIEGLIRAGSQYKLVMLRAEAADTWLALNPKRDDEPKVNTRKRAQMEKNSTAGLEADLIIEGAVEAVRRVHEELSSRIEVSVARLPAFRKELERFFAE